MTNDHFGNQVEVAYEIFAKVYSVSLIILFGLNILTVGNNERLTDSVTPLQVIVFQALVSFPLPGNVLALYI